MPSFKPCGPTTTVSGNNCCQNPMSQFILLRNFFQNIADGLKDVTENLIEVLNRKGDFEQIENLGLIITVNVEPPPICINDNSYFIYIQRYGPPCNGIFDPLLLECIRSEIRDAHTCNAGS